MSKWINKELFVKFKEQVTSRPTDETSTFTKKWNKLVMGTVDAPMVYEGRFLPDKTGNPAYKKYHYHMFESGGGWEFFLCPKTYGDNVFCGFCLASKKLWSGTESDKKAASKYKRNDRFVANFYIVSDPRDKDIPADAENREDKVASGKVKLFEFPPKLESKVAQELKDEKEGLGEKIFDPGEDGNNFIIKIKATKRDKNNKVWPDYSDSKFSIKSYPLGTDKEIKLMLEQCENLDSYLKSIEKPPTEIKKLLQQEMLMDFVSTEWKRNILGDDVNKSPENEMENVTDVPWDDDLSDLDKELSNI